MPLDKRGYKMSTSMVEQDLAAARKQGKTYNEFYRDARNDQIKKGQLTREAIDSGGAAGLYSPKEVKREVDSWNKPQAKPNSVTQYNNEKSAGGAMTDISYEEWKI